VKIKNVLSKYTLSYDIPLSLNRKKKNLSMRERKINGSLQGRDFFTTPARKLNLSAWRGRGKVLNHIYIYIYIYNLTLIYKTLIIRCLLTADLTKFAVLFYFLALFILLTIYESKIPCQILFLERENIIHIFITEVNA